MATTDLKLDQPGSLPRPGPFGRIARLAFGFLCLWQINSLILVSDHLIGADGHLDQVTWNGMVIGLFLISYIVNIGFSRAWKKWPAIVSAGVILAIAGFGYVTAGNAETYLLARSVWLWEFYLFAHLGTAFMLSAVIGTPGCEMRAFHDLYSRITGNSTKEHYCPVGPLHPIDQWEVRRRHA